MQRRAVGIDGEQAAADWYAANGYDVLARNWRCRQGELDLILRRGRTVVFCEVKSRTSDAFGAPVEAITHAKRERLRRLAAWWLEHDAPFRPGEIRFDVASVMRGQVEIIEGAF
jgi:putative endonuclease